MIDRPQGVTVDDAARDLRCTIRTIWRDLDTLQQAGFPLYTERAADGNRGVWRVTEDFKRALPLKLTLGELAALLVDVVGRLRRLLDDPPYSVALHTGPLDGSRQTDYHWHWEIVPLVGQELGMEWATGIVSNPVPPEAAADALRHA
jgi:hypothetical protein